MDKQTICLTRIPCLDRKSAIVGNFLPKLLISLDSTRGFSCRNRSVAPHGVPLVTVKMVSCESGGGRVPPRRMLGYCIQLVLATSRSFFRRSSVSARGKCAYRIRGGKSSSRIFPGKEPLIGFHSPNPFPEVENGGASGMRGLIGKPHQ